MTSRPFGLFISVVVGDNERAFLSRDGRFERVLGPGRHKIFDPGRRLSAEVFSVLRAEFPIERYRALKASHPATADALFTVVETGAREFAIVAVEGRPLWWLSQWQARAFWKVVNTLEVERIDTTLTHRVPDDILGRLTVVGATSLMTAVIDAHEVGLLHLDGQFVEVLSPGRHSLWNVDRKVEILRYDLRPVAVEISAQELLTKDRIALRVTLTAFRRIVDPVRLAGETQDVAGFVYRLVQFAIREAVSGRTLDEILSAKSTIDQEIRAYVAGRVADVGLEVTDLGIRDVILPGEIRELVNKVVEAERTAKANLIRRQEETAATRSLLNTAKLMEDNPLLLRLKELESLERVVEKVGKIDLHAGDGQGLDVLLSGLLRLKSKD